MSENDRVARAVGIVQDAIGDDRAGDYASALPKYREGAACLLEAAEFETDPTLRETIKAKTAEYSRRADELELRGHAKSHVPEEIDLTSSPSVGIASSENYNNKNTKVHISRRGSVLISTGAPFSAGSAAQDSDDDETIQFQLPDVVGAASDGDHLRRAEEAFKERYAVLKSIYQQRIETLAGQIDAALGEVQNDPIRNAMAADPLTANFAQERAREVAGSSLARERERFIELLSEKLAASQADLSSIMSSSKATAAALNSELAEQHAQCESLAKALKAETQSKESERNAAENAKGELERTKAKLKHLEDVRTSEKEEMHSAVERLKAMMKQASGSNAKTEAAQKLVGTLEAKVDEQTRTLEKVRADHEATIARERRSSISTAQDAHAKIIRLNAALEESTRQCEEEVGKYEAVSSRYDELASAHEALKIERSDLESSSKHAKALLERSEKERLELREQYMALGDKLEAALDSEQKGAANEVLRLQEKVRRGKEKLAKAASAYKEKNASKKASIARLEADILSLKDELQSAGYENKGKDRRIESLESELNNARVQRETSVERGAQRISEVEEELQGARGKIDELRDELRKARGATSKAVNAAREECRKLMDEQRRAHIVELDKADKLRRNVEAERWKEQRATEEKMHVQYQRLVESKISELSETQMRWTESRDDDTRLQQLVDSRMDDLGQNFVKRSEHDRIVASRVQAARNEEEQARNELVRKHEESIRTKLKEMEERKQHEYAVAMLNVRQGIKKLETQLEEEKGDRREAERALEEERKSVAAYRHKNDEDERNKQLLVAHLEESSANMSRLKQMIAEQSEKLSVAEQTAQDAKDERNRAMREASEHGAQLARLEAELGERTKRLQQLEDRTVQSTENSTSNFKRLAELERACAALEGEKTKLEEVAQQVSDAHARTVESLHQEHSATVERLKEEAKVDAERHGEAVSLLSAQIATLEEEKRGLQSKIEEAEGSHAELQKRLAASDEARAQALGTNDRLTKSLETLRKSAEENQKEILDGAIKLREQIAAYKAELKAKSHLIEEADKRLLSEKRRRVREANVMVSRFQARLRPLKEHALGVLSSAKVEIEAAKSDAFRQVRELQWKVREAMSKGKASWLSRWEAEREHLESKQGEEKASASESYRKALEDQARQLRLEADAQIAVLQERADALTASCAEERDRRAEVESARQELNAELQSERQKLTLLVKEHGEAKEAINGSRRRGENLESKIRRLEGENEDLEGRASSLQTSVSDLEQKLKLLNSNILSVMVTLSGELSISQEVMEGVASLDGSETFRTTLSAFQQELKAAVKEMTGASSKAAVAPVEKENTHMKQKIEILGAELRDLRQADADAKRTMESLEQKLQEEETRRRGRERELEERRQEAESCLEEHTSIVELAKIESASRERVLEGELEALRSEYEAEKRAWEKRHRNAIEVTSTANGERVREMRAQMEAEESRHRETLQREREKNRALETEILSMSSKVDQGSLDDSLLLTPIPLDKSRSSVLNDSQLQHLLEHSLALDERARELTRSAHKRRSRKHRSRSRDRATGTSSLASSTAGASSGFGGTPERHRRRQSLDVSVGGVHMHLNRQGSMDMRFDAASQ